MSQATPPPPQLADVVARLRRAMRRAARAADPGHRLSVAQLELLACLAEHPDARPGQLARQLRLAPNSVTTLVNALVAEGVVARTSGGPDRRTVALRLTPAGAGTLQRWQAANATILDTAVAALPTGQQQALRAALPALDQLIEQVDALADQPERAGEAMLNLSEAEEAAWRPRRRRYPGR
jgi:DNA-binding MarR family transcriptional regulator